MRKGETGTTVVFASAIIRTELTGGGDDVERTIPFIKAYTVFNADQINGLDRRIQRDADFSDPLDRIGTAGRFFANTGALIRHGGSSAYYAAAHDYIQMPHLPTFKDDAAYVAVLSHEMTHWTSKKPGLIAIFPAMQRTGQRARRTRCGTRQCFPLCRSRYCAGTSTPV